jgi:hypothetical protein
MMEEVMEYGPHTLPLHLKITSWHDNQMRMGQAQPLVIGELKSILVPRQQLLKKLDPTGELSVQTVRAQLEPLLRQYWRLFIQDRVDGGMQMKYALKIYNFFHREQQWGEIAVFKLVVCNQIPMSLLHRLSGKSASP